MKEGRSEGGGSLTGLKPVVVLTVRREISSTLGRKTASWEGLARLRRRSQGESWVEPEKKALLPAKARPKVKPSPRWIRESLQGSYTPLVSPAASDARMEAKASARASSRGAEAAAMAASEIRGVSEAGAARSYQL